MTEAKVLMKITKVGNEYQAYMPEVDGTGFGADPVLAMKDAFVRAHEVVNVSVNGYERKIAEVDAAIASYKRDIERMEQIKAGLVANHETPTLDVLELEKSPYLGAVYHGAMVIMPEVVCGIEAAWKIDFTSAKVVKTNLPPPSMPFRTDPQCGTLDQDKPINVIDVGTKRED
jgi:hypothetical protein